jgi:hypothetical protein
MLLTILGTHALGKTTYCRELPARFPVQALLGDNGRLITAEGEQKLRWRLGSATEKAIYLDDYVSDDTLLTVAEGCRFFGGTIIHEIAELYRQYTGGVKFLIINTTAEVMLECMRARCDGKDKEFRLDYWASKADYYATRKYPNSVRMHAEEIPTMQLQFTGDYQFWKHEVDPLIARMLEETWYE